MKCNNSFQASVKVLCSFWLNLTGIVIQASGWQAIKYFLLYRIFVRIKSLRSKVSSVSHIWLLMGPEGVAQVKPLECINQAGTQMNQRSDKFPNTDFHFRWMNLPPGMISFTCVLLAGWYKMQLFSCQEPGLRCWFVNECSYKPLIPVFWHKRKHVCGRLWSFIYHMKGREESAKVYCTVFFFIV